VADGGLPRQLPAVSALLGQPLTVQLNELIGLPAVGRQTMKRLEG
jgi:hypothetical protein